MPSGPTGLDFEVFANHGPRTTPRNRSGLLSWARALLQSPPSSQRPLRPPCLSTQRQQNGASHEVCSPSASPRTWQRHLEPGLPHRTRLRPQVFSTSRRLHPPRACRPCFMPDPLMGLHPSELCSSRAAVRRLRRPSPHAVGQPLPARTSRTEVRYEPDLPEPPRLQGLAPRESPPHLRRRFRPARSA